MTNMKKRKLRKPIKVALEVAAVVSVTAIIATLLLGSVLQESYKLNPPTDEEVMAEPGLEKYR